MVLPALLVAAILPAGGSAATDPRHEAPRAECTCEAAEQHNGWCDLHAVGYVASVAIKSKLLHDTLDAHGHEVDPVSFDCPSCREAIESGGFCEDHRIGFVNRLAYFSRLTYELARASWRDPAGLTCTACRRHASSKGWCEDHGVGWIGGFEITDLDAWARAAAAFEVLILAVEKSEECDWCAQAMIHDSDCPRHGVHYRNGRPVTDPAPRAGTPR